MYSNISQLVFFLTLPTVCDQFSSQFVRRISGILNHLQIYINLLWYNKQMIFYKIYIFIYYGYNKQMIFYKIYIFIYGGPCIQINNHHTDKIQNVGFCSFITLWLTYYMKQYSVRICQSAKIKLKVIVEFCI